MRQYETRSGTYTEEELAVVVWINPKSKGSRQSRALETMTSENSRYPMAFPIRSLTKNRSWKNAVVARTKEDVFLYISESGRSKPVVIPLAIAKEALGWNDFYIPSEYTEK